MHELDGGAKAMVVTSSREHALRYYFAIRDYSEAKGYEDMRVIVAFSGEVEYERATWTEAAVNGFSETKLPRRFAETPELRFLVVAEKYQTGFDEPALCAMYVDRKLARLQAVQTLSRLNRTHSRFPDKRTFVLDFQNSTEDIWEAFRPYFEATELEDVSDPNQVYELYDRLYTFGVIDQGEVDRFSETYFRGPLPTADRIRLEGLVRQAVERYRDLDDEGEQEEFRQPSAATSGFTASLRKW